MHIEIRAMITYTTRLLIKIGFKSLFVFNNKILRLNCYSFLQFRPTILNIKSLLFLILRFFRFSLPTLILILILLVLSLYPFSLFLVHLIHFSFSIFCSGTIVILLLYSVCSQMILNLLFRQLFLQVVLLVLTFIYAKNSFKFKKRQ